MPTAVVWPGVVKPGTNIGETVSNLDWRPTLAEIADASVSDGAIIRGRSIVPLLKGETSDWDNGFYGEYSTHHQTRTDMRMYRTPEWKLVRDLLDPNRDELYDLRNDPEETKNRIGSNDPKLQQVIADLDGKIREAMKRNGDPLVRAIE